ncbi:MAG: GNAT family N-acetyltransferase [Bacteroidales bacterium]|nr:GNAT family N-acetyltransferase [Bacteroidales bacterium]
MIRYLKHSEIDWQKWDDLVSDCGNVYALSWYLNVVHPNFEALVEIENGNYLSLMPLTGKKKFGISYLCQPFFAQQLGVFFREKLTKEKLSEFLQAIPKKYCFAEFRLNESNAIDDTLQNFENHRNIVLDLNGAYDAFRANYHSNTKRNLAKAENFHLQFVDGVGLDAVIALFRANRGAEVKVWGDREYDVLRHLAAEAMRRDAAFVCGVRAQDSDVLLCGALFLKFNGVVTFLFSGCGPEGKEKQAMTFMLDRIIQRFANQAEMLDFEGSDNDNLARFYLGFGGREVGYPSYTFNRLPWLGKRLLSYWKRR